MRRQLRSEAGATTTELVLLMPVVLLLVVLVVQFGLWLHARQVATAAAQEALSVVQRDGGTVEAGRTRAEQFLADAGGLRDAGVEVDRGAETASVRVAGGTPALVPGLDLGIDVLVQGPVERFVPEPDR